MSEGKQKTTTTQTRQVAAPSQNESLLEAANTRAAQQQAQYLQQAMAAQQALENSQGYQQMMGIGPQAAQGLQGLMSNGMMPSQQQQAALQQYYQSIMAPQLAQMQQTAQQEAARRGMTVSDSPIGGDYLRQLANYQAQMGGQQAGSALQLGQQNANMYQNALNFGGQLQQNAAQNRLALASAQPGSYSFGNQLAQNRIQSAPVSVTQTSTQPASQSFGQYAKGFGDIMGGINSGVNAYTGGGRSSISGMGGIQGLGGIKGIFGLGG